MKEGRGENKESCIAVIQDGEGRGINRKNLPERTHPHLTTPTSLGSSRTLLRTQSHKLDVEIASSHHHQPNMKICKVCNEAHVEDECHLLHAQQIRNSEEM